MDSTQNVISFCTGYAGLELGLIRAGVDVRTVCYVEVEVYVQAVLAQAIQEKRLCSAPLWTDAKTFPAQEFRGLVDGVTLGYPCQPFSSAGKRKGEKDPRHLWPHLRKHIQTINPSWVFAENVHGHVSLGLSTVLADLEEDGYEAVWGIFSAEETGAPHQRKRVYILAKLPDSDCLRGEISDRREHTSESLPNSDGEARGTELAHSKCERHRGRTTEGSDRVDTKGSDFKEERKIAHDLRSETSGCCGESRKLGNSEHDGLSEDKVGRGSKETSNRSEKGKEATQQSSGTSGRENLSDLQGAELAHTKNGRRKPSKSKGRQDSERGSTDRGRASGEGQETKWPARPGQKQHDWEEPRVTEAKPQLGGTTDGFTCGVDPIANRTDRLRLLGNGVVPQTAEIAWKTLWREMNENHRQEETNDS